MRHWLTTNEAAQLLGVSTRSVIAMCEDGRLWSFRRTEQRGQPRNICLTCARRLRTIRETLLVMWQELYFGERACGHQCPGPKRTNPRPPC